jgi:alginate O-acetyltransferase complex protein AlgI
MLFTQFEFIFIFVPVTISGYFLLARLFKSSTPRLIWLTAASLFFYGYWDARFLPVIGLSIVINYLFGLRLIAEPVGSRERKRVFVIAIAANLAALAVFKYTNFFADTVTWLTHGHIHFHDVSIVLPLGISFFTFTQIAYLADVFVGHAYEANFAKYCLFVTYFPHLVAGPILHHREMMPQFGAEESRRFSAERVAVGLTVFGIGLFKKVIIADGFSLIANPAFAAASQGSISAIDAWCGALAYSLQIYFDFSGYCDMAIGLSTMLGIVLPFNFDAPYKSRSIVEFWRRWHITLSRFLRDYLYIPLGGGRQGERRRYVNLLTTMVLGGLWHGAGWTFVIWGALHGAFLIVNHGWTKLRGQSSVVARMSAAPGYAIATLLLTQFCVVIAWVFFRADSLRTATRMLASMTGSGASAAPISNGVAQFALIAAAYVFCICAPNVNTIFRHRNVGLQTYSNDASWSILDFKWRPSLGWAVATAAVLLVATLVSVMTSDISPFLYFQF